MSVRLHSFSPSLFILPLFFISISMAIGSNDTRYPDCPSYNCNGVSIGYPFWRITDQPGTRICGYHGLGINCSNVEGEDGPKIRLGDEWYHVRNIADTSIILADNNFVNNNLVDTECPRVNHTIDLESLPLNFSTGNLNLSFHFDCSGSSPNYAIHIPCMNSGSKRSYVNVIHEYDERFAWDCENEVVTTVLDVFRVTNNNRMFPWSEYARALIYGFELDLLRPDDCDKCEQSNGRCGFNNANTSEFLCFCSDGTTMKDDCKKEKRFLLPAFKNDEYEVREAADNSEPAVGEADCWTPSPFNFNHQLPRIALILFLVISN